MSDKICKNCGLFMLKAPKLSKTAGHCKNIKAPMRYVFTISSKDKACNIFNHK